MILSPRWHKIFHDFWSNKIRSALVILSIFIGVFSVGITISLYRIFDEDLDYSYKRIHPYHAQLWTSDFNPDVLNSLKKVDGLAEIDCRRSTQVQFHTQKGDWIPLHLTILPNYTNQHLGLIEPNSGEWPPRIKQLYLDRGSFRFAQVNIGDDAEIKLVDDTIRTIHIAGAVNDGYASIASALGIYGIVTMDSLEWLHEPLGCNSILLTVRDENSSKAGVETVAKNVGEQAQKAGITVYYTISFKPGENPSASQILGVVAVLGILGFLTIALAGFLIFNTLSALITQHIRYIGVMKAVGARSSQIIGMYISLISLYSFVAVAAAIPLSTQVANGIASIMAQQFNYISLGFRFVPQSVLWQIIIGFGVPLLSGLIPVIQGTRITIREALSDYGLGKGQFGKTTFDRFIEHIRHLPRPTLISIRNTFRRKGRLIRTLSTLALGGAIFIGVFNLRQSLVLYINQITKYFLSDVTISFAQNYPIVKVAQDIKEIPGVAHVEGWSSITGDLMKDPKTADETIAILAPPASSPLIEPIMISGRWILPGDENALVVNNAFWRVRPELKVGDTITIRIRDKLTQWKIVGFFKFPGDYQLIAYANYDYISSLTNTPNRAAEYRVLSNIHNDPLKQKQFAQQVEAYLKAKGYQVINIQTGSALVEANTSAINIIIGFFLFNAILIALVGAIGLMGTMSMNVLERSREIGVLRAIGATDRKIFNMVLTEGMIIGTLSWIFSILIAIPISRIMFNVLMMALFRSTGNFSLSINGFIIWLIVALVLSWLASLIPARNAARMTIREVLAYE